MSKAKGSPKTGGRQKGSKNRKYIFLPDMFDSKNLQWRTDIVRMLKRMPEALRFRYYIELMPYLAAKMDAQPYKPATPEESKKNVVGALELMKALELKSGAPKSTPNDSTLPTIGH